MLTLRFYRIENLIFFRDKILPYLRKLGFNPAKDLTFMPVSGQLGIGLKDPIPEHLCNWYSGPPFIPFIDSLPSLNRKSNGPFIMPIVDKYKDMGTVVMGKVEAGEAKKGQSLLVMPNRVRIFCFYVIILYYSKSKFIFLLAHFVKCYLKFF